MVLIARDDHEPAFDHAVNSTAEKLTGIGMPRQVWRSWSAARRSAS
jgi:hypothetical protein